MIHRRTARILSLCISLLLVLLWGGTMLFLGEDTVMQNDALRFIHRVGPYMIFDVILLTSFALYQLCKRHEEAAKREATVHTLLAGIAFAVALAWSCAAFLLGEAVIFQSTAWKIGWFCIPLVFFIVESAIDHHLRPAPGGKKDIPPDR